MEHRPIFIGGLSFTGKTQLRLMLSAHPNIFIARRTHMWDRFYNRYGGLTESENFERCLHDLVSAKYIQSLHFDVERIRNEFKNGTVSYEKLFAAILSQSANHEGKTRWGDQLGFVEHYADAIFAAYPSARMIHMVRDPGTRSGESAFVSSRRAGRIGWETAWWLSSARLASRHQKRYAGRYLVLRYERLFASPEPALREICSFLDETFYPEMLTHGEINSHAAGIQLPLPERDLFFVRSCARKVMGKFGYAYDGLRLSWKDRVLYSLGWPVNLAALLAGMLGAGLGRRELFQRELAL